MSTLVNRVVVCFLLATCAVAGVAVNAFAQEGDQQPNVGEESKKTAGEEGRFVPVPPPRPTLTRPTGDDGQDLFRSKQGDLYDLSPLVTHQGVSLEDFVRAMARVLEIKLTYDPKNLTARKVVIIGDAKPGVMSQDGSGDLGGFWAPRSAMKSLLVGVLRQNNLGLEKIVGGKVAGDLELYELVASAELKGGATTVYFGDDVNIIPDNVEFVTMVLHVKCADPNLVFRAITNLLSRPDGFAQPITGVNAILISDYANNIKRMASIIRLIDRQPERTVRTIKVTNRPVEELAPALERFERWRRVFTAGQYVADDDMIDFQIDQRLNLVVIQSTEEAFNKVKALVESLDAKGDEAGRQPPTVKKVTRVYHARHRKAGELYPPLRALLDRENPTDLSDQRVDVTVDEAQNALVVRAPAWHHEMVEEILAAIDAPKPTAPPKNPDPANKEEKEAKAK
ncbi:MAG: hypothetical protein HY719_03760 [Planctomycetes bacterium]|nr:hypothetical protein [Planctomycetota bacterium]